MAEDILFREGLTSSQSNDNIFNQTLIKIEDRLLMVAGKTLKDFSLPEANRQRNEQSYDMIRETSYPIAQLERILDQIPNLNEGQKIIFEEFKTAISQNLGGYW